MIKQILLITLLVLMANAVPLMDSGSFYVSGFLMCRGKPYSKMPIQVYEKNYVLPDTLLVDMKTNDDGSFYIKHWGRDWFSFDPYLYVPNYCISAVYEGGKCTTGAMMIQIPEAYISNSEVPISQFKIGDFEMSNQVPFETQGLGSVLAPSLVSTRHCMADENR